MNEMLPQPIIEMGIALTELAVKGTASNISKRIRAAKEIKEVEKLRTTYDELINEVIQEREEAVRIALAYKAELDRINISDDDIQHLQAFKDLVSADTLKTMQLLGFNYKAAIGEPLTKLCAEAISSWGKKKNENPFPGQSTCESFDRQDSLPIK